MIIIFSHLIIYCGHVNAFPSGGLEKYASVTLIPKKLFQNQMNHFSPIRLPEKVLVLFRLHFQEQFYQKLNLV